MSNKQLNEIAAELEARAVELRLLASLEPPAPTPAPPPPQLTRTPPSETEAYFDDYGKFYDFLRADSMLGPVISTSEFQGCDAIILAFARAGSPLSHVAYGLATAYLETAMTMQPVKEIGGNAYYTRMYDITGQRPKKARELGNLTPGDGARFPGRGYPQLTGRTNYARATAKLRALGFDVDLVADPDRAMEPEIAAVIMVQGMTEGWFTGRKLSDDLPSDGVATLKQFTVSRDIINGVDKQVAIAEFAMKFQRGLVLAGYRRWQL